MKVHTAVHVTGLHDIARTAAEFRPSVPRAWLTTGAVTWAGHRLAGGVPATWEAAA